MFVSWDPKHYQQYDMLGYDVDIIITITIATTMNKQTKNTRLLVLLLFLLEKCVFLELLLLIVLSFLAAKSGFCSKPFLQMIVCFLVDELLFWSQTDLNL